MSYRAHLRGIGSGAVYDKDTVMNLCPVDGRPVEIVMDLEKLAAEKPNLAWYRPERRDMWRFGALLALDIEDPEDGRSICTLGEGYTPGFDYSDQKIARAAAFKLCFKDEGRAHPGYGANPTQSFKDRGMAMVVSMARRLGLEKLAVPTQGNAGDSLAEYARAAGLAAAIAMPDDTPMPILGRVAALARLDPRIELGLVSGTIREAGEKLGKDWLPRGYFSVATFQEPGWRIDGKKTLGLELCEPGAMGNESWRMPDVIVYPTGGGTGILGMWKAFEELAALGVVDGPPPRIVAVQSAATAPLVDAFDRGAEDTVPADPGETLATGLNVPGGVGHFRVLEILRASGGAALAVDESEMARTLTEVWRDKGWWICPEGAATIAALARCVDEKLIRRGDRVAVINTGSFEKYLPNLRRLL